LVVSPDGTDSPVISNPPACEQLGEDDIEKRVRVNEDGSLSMEMKVRFKLQNDETLHWSTEVTKTAGRACEYHRGYNSPYFSQVGDGSYSGSENISMSDKDDSYGTVRRARHRESHCPQCCPHCREYDIWKNIPGVHGASRCIQSSSSSASSRTVVSRKTGDDVQPRASRPSSQNSEPEKEDTAGSGEMQTESQHSSPSPTDVASNASGSSSKPKDSENQHTCHCGVDEDDTNEQMNAQTEEEEEEEEEEEDILKDQSSAISVKTNASCTSDKSEDKEETESKDGGEERSKSAMSVHSNASMKSGKSVNSEVTLEESKSETDVGEDRALSSMSSKSKASNKSKGSRISSIPDVKTTEDEIEQRTPSAMSESKQETSEGSVEESMQLSAEENETARDTQSAMSGRSIKSSLSSAPKDLRNADHVICDNESNKSDLSQTLSSSDIVKEICETTAPGEATIDASPRLTNGPVSVPDHKSDRSAEADDFDLVPSRLPNASPTEVVNEWLKTLPAENDAYDMEEFNEDTEEQQTVPGTEKINTGEQNDDSDDSTAINSKDKNKDEVIKNDESKVFNSSIQVMKVLLNPKVDRCNSLPEISPVYGRKLSTSARGLLDSLVKLQLIDNDPKNANEKDERYKELMNILQSLWLCEPPKHEYTLKDDHHSVDDDFNHTSSSGVDVNSGSTGSGKSSDGVKKTSVNTLQEAQKICEAEPQWTSDRDSDEKKLNEEDPATDETIRSDDSQREIPETPSSTNKSSGNDSSGQKSPGEAEMADQEDMQSESSFLLQSTQLIKEISQDPDPIWVLSLLTNIKKQFMKHYVNAMKEFQVRWNLGDNEKLEEMINDLKTGVHNKIQASIDRE
uniref:Uncharacterized protein n=1 Tax=Salarias fasciatus TaxID=181472 RepID=A0A672FI98_SALFA